MNKVSGRLLLREFYDLDVREIKESKDVPGAMYLVGIIQRADQKNQNGRIYPRKVLEKALKDYQKKIDDNRSAGEANHPSNSIDVDLLKISHIIKEVWWEGDDLYARLQITSNSVGKDIRALVEDGLKLGISSRGHGSVSKKDEGIVVNEDFELICFDLVHDPSTAGAFLLKEGVYRRIEEEELFIETKITKGKSKLHSLVEQILKIEKV